jgi:hypothetical protein
MVLNNPQAERMPLANDIQEPIASEIIVPVGFFPESPLLQSRSSMRI